MASLFSLPKAVAIQLSGIPYAGAKLYFFEAGTVTAAPVYQDINLGTPHAQPVVANDQGYFPAIYLDPTSATNYRIQLKTSAGALIFDQDDYPASSVTAAQVGRALYPQSAAELSKGVTPTDYSYPIGDVRRYGAACDGVTNDAAAIQKALNVEGLVTLAPGKVCYVATGLTMDASTTTFDGRGGAIKSGLTSGTVLDVSSTNGAEAVARNGIRNFILYADSIVSGVTGINFEKTTGAYVAGLNVNNVSISYLFVAVRIYSNAFCVNFSGCMLSQNTNAVYIPGGGDNYGEKITFNHCFLGNNTRCFWTLNESCQVHVLNCSLDYSNEIVRCEAGWFMFDNCYIENNLDTERWFIASGPNSRIVYRGGIIAVVGAKTAYALAFTGASGQIDFEGVTLYSATNNVGGSFLGDGAGYTLAKNCKIAGFSNSIYAWAGGSTYHSMCSNGAFTTDLGGWTTTSNTAGGGGYPTRAATAGSTGGPALQMYVSVAANDQAIYWEIPASPGDVVGAAFAVKAENLTSSVGWQIQCLGNDNVVVGSTDALPGQTYFNATFPSADTSWHDRRVTQARCPKGTTKARLVLSADYVGGFKAWIENVVMCRY